MLLCIYFDSTKGVLIRLFSGAFLLKLKTVLRISPNNELIDVRPDSNYGSDFKLNDCHFKASYRDGHPLGIMLS